MFDEFVDLADLFIAAISKTLYLSPWDENIISSPILAGGEYKTIIFLN